MLLTRHRIALVAVAFALIAGVSAWLDIGPDVVDAGADANVATTCTNANWMACMLAASPDVPLSQIAMPGSHDAGTDVIGNDAPDPGEGGGIGQAQGTYLDTCGEQSSMVGGATTALGITQGWAQTQELDLYGQAAAGARYFDVRGIVYDGAIHHCHSDLGDSWDAMFGVNGNTRGLTQFVHDNPGEILLVDVTHLYASTDTSPSYDTDPTFANYFTQNGLCAYGITRDEVSAAGASGPAALTPRMMAAAGKRMVFFVEDDYYDAQGSAVPCLFTEDSIRNAQITSGAVDISVSGNSSSSVINAQIPALADQITGGYTGLLVSQWIYYYSNNGSYAWLATNTLRGQNQALAEATPQPMSMLKYQARQVGGFVNIVLLDFVGDPTYNLDPSAAQAVWQTNAPGYQGGRYPLAQTPVSYDFDAMMPGCPAGDAGGACDDKPSNTSKWCAVNIDLTDLRPPASDPDSTVFVEVQGAPGEIAHGELYAFNGVWQPNIPGDFAATTAPQLDPENNPGWLAEAPYGALLQDDPAGNTGATGTDTPASGYQVGWIGAGSDGTFTGCEGGINLWDSGSGKPFMFLQFSVDGSGNIDDDFTCYQVGIPGAACSTSSHQGANDDQWVMTFTVTGQPAP